MDTRARWIYTRLHITEPRGVHNVASLDIGRVRGVTLRLSPVVVLIYSRKAISVM